ncbi:DUF7482 domain-containing protein [Nitrosopumilus sp.]|uniref:DUF7482 domain-containing protein n=1 Tax=Nitrosopumilus sp. TaxID=2024843 RepID=UPI002930369C|nr:hypothetical protein [Nitrosopumilus sp.]
MTSKKTIPILFIMTVLMTSATMASVEIIPSAEAVKSKGTSLPKTGSVGSPVCGDRLCGEVKLESGDEDHTSKMQQQQASSASMKQQPHLPDTNLPIDIPLTKGYANGNEIFYISTEASIEDVANHLTDLTGFKVTYTPALGSAPAESLAQIYAFTNGVEGSGVFGFQPQVADSQPGEEKYSPLWNVNAVTWNDGAEPRELKSETAILEARDNGELTIEEAGVIVNCPFVKWDGGQLQIRENTHITDDDPYGGGQVTDIDTENMKVTFVAHRGFAPNGDTIYYIATDASVKEVADMLGVIHVPKVQETISNAASSDLYVFTNGLEGNGPMGFQASIGSTNAGDQFYSPLWRIQTATWADETSAEFLTMTSEISQAASSGNLDTGLAGFVVNCPFVEVSADMIDNSGKNMHRDDMAMKDDDKDADKDKKMMMDKNANVLKGDLTSPVGPDPSDDPFGGDEIVGDYKIKVINGEQVDIYANLNPAPEGTVLEGWLVDLESGHTLSTGKANDKNEMAFTQLMVNPTIYDAFVITAEPINDTDPAPAELHIGGAPIGELFK